MNIVDFWEDFQVKFVKTKEAKRWGKWTTPIVKMSLKYMISPILEEQNAWVLLSILKQYSLQYVNMLFQKSFFILKKNNNNPPNLPALICSEQKAVTHQLCSNKIQTVTELNKQSVVFNTSYISMITQKVIKFISQQ